MRGVGMSLGRHSFKLNDATRLVRALKAAGLSILRVELDNGKVIAVTDSEAAAGRKPGDEVPGDEVEDWVSKHARKR
jgi:hypothetical protein